jgi:hypothetical protein
VHSAGQWHRTPGDVIGIHMARLEVDKQLVPGPERWVAGPSAQWAQLVKSGHRFLQRAVTGPEPRCLPCTRDPDILLSTQLLLS